MPHPLRLYDRDGALLAQITVDDAYLEGDGHRIGTYYPATGNEMLDEIPFDLDHRIRWGQHGDFELRLPMGTWHITVAAAGEVRVDGALFGRIDGYEDSPAGHRRAAALIAGVTVVTPPARKRAPPDAPPAAKPISPPPPAPPPPLHHHHRTSTGAR